MRKRSRMAKTNEAIFTTEVRKLLHQLTTARRPWTLRKARREFERAYVNYVIRLSDDERPRAAKRLKIGFSTLKEKIRGG